MDLFLRKASFKIVAAILTTMMMFSSSVNAAEEKLYKPFVLANTPAGDFNAVADATKKSLEGAGFNIVGDYLPFDGTRILVITNDSLLKAAAENKETGFAAVQRVSVVSMDGKIQVAFTNPEYMGMAYRLKTSLSAIKTSLVAALGEQKTFGAEGLTEKKLRDYNYAWGMEYYDDFLQLAEYRSHKQALEAVENGFKTNKIGASKVYRVEIPGTNNVLYGVGLKSPNMFNKYQDDGYIMGIIDFKKNRSAAHLPYELMVSGNKVIALHARFRIAINFPDLSMAGEHSFMNIMGAPAGIKKALTIVAGGDPNDF